MSRLPSVTGLPLPTACTPNAGQDDARLPPGSIRRTRPRGGVEQYIITRDALAELVLAMRRGDPDGLWRDVLRQMDGGGYQGGHHLYRLESL